MTYRVMIADDEPPMRKALADFIDWSALDCVLVYTAENGKDLLAHLQEYEPHIVITDIKMPGTDGIEIARSIYTDAPHIKVIFLTGFADFSYAKAGITYNVVDYVVKTGSFEGLTAAVEKAKRLIAEERHAGTGKKNLIAAFYKSVFDRSLRDADLIAEQAQKLHIRLENYAVIYCSYKAQSHDDAVLFMSFFENADCTRSVTLIPFADNTVYIVMEGELPAAEIVFSSKAAPLPVFDMNYVRETIEAFTRRFSDFDMRAGISHICYDIKGLSDAAVDARTAHADSFYAGSECVFLYTRNTYHKASEFSSELHFLLNTLLTRIAGYDICGAQEAEAELFEFQKSKKIVPDDVVMSLVDFINRCNALLVQKNIDCILSAPACLPDFSAYCAAVSSCSMQTLERLKAALPHTLNIVKETQKWIDEHYCEPVSLERIASHIGVNGSYLSRIFSEKTHTTLVRYINELKINRAKHLLSDPDIQISDVALSVGIENTQYFCKLFKKITGESPSGWRELFFSDRL